MTFAPDLSLHLITRQLCDAYVRDPATGLLLSGDDGSGLETLAMAIATSLNNHPDGVMTIIADGDRDITIEQIRQLYHDTRTIRDHHLTVIIAGAERMSLPAQNAFLKLLEEPPARVVFVMTSHSPNMLLPTIRSRIAHIEVRPISRDESVALLARQGITDEIKIGQLLFVAGGKPAKLVRLIQDDGYFADCAEMIRLARTFVTESSYTRLTMLADIALDRSKALAFLRTMGEVVMFGHKKSPTRRMTRQLDHIVTAIDKLEANANVRLQLLRLALTL